MKGGQSPLQDETPNETADGDDSDDYMDEGMRVVDQDALTRITQVIKEHATEIESAQAASGKIIYYLFLILSGHTPGVNYNGVGLYRIQLT